MIIYKVTNIKNNKSYIGQTTQKFSIKKTQHIRYDKHLQTHFYRALKKYGKENFEWEIIEKCNSKNDLNLAEEWYIRYFDTYNNGYNSTTGGNGTSGHQSSKKGKTFEEMYGAEKSKLLKKIQGNKVSKTLQGRTWDKYLSVETIQKFKQKYSNRMKINNPMFNPEIVKKHSIKLAKKYLIISPDGTEEIINNITKYCKKNKHHAGYMCQLANGNLKYYKGFKCKKI